MKKLTLCMAVMAIVGAASATLVWEENFDTAPGLTADGNINVPSERTGVDWWYGLGATTTNGVLEMLGKENNATRGAIKIWSGLFGAGEYQLEFDWTQLRPSALSSLHLYTADRNNGGWNGVVAGPSGTIAGVSSLGGAVAELANTDLVGLTSGADPLTTHVSWTFNYNGTHDLVFVGGIEGYTWNNLPAAQIDNVTITQIPEPATIGMIGLAGLVAFAARRFRIG